MSTPHEPTDLTFGQLHAIHGGAEAARRKPVHFSSWQDKPVPVRQWIVQDWIPAGETTLLYGDGGAGKTTLIQQLAAAVGSDGAVDNFFGSPIAHGPVVALFCEDSEDEHHIRQAAINVWARVDYSEVDVTALFSKGEDNALALIEQNGLLLHTPLWHQLRELVGDTKAKLLAIDPASEVFTGNENDRGAVSRFVKQICTKLGLEFGCGVVLAAHPSRTGITTGDGTSGSTAWSNAARSRMYLHKPDADGPLVLERKKSNYGPTEARIELSWAEGCFWLHGRRFDQARRDRDDEDAFISALRRVMSRGAQPTVSAQSPNGAVRLAGLELDKRSPGTPRLRAAQNRLLDGGRLSWKRNPSGGAHANLIVFPGED